MKTSQKAPHAIVDEEKQTRRVSCMCTLAGAQGRAQAWAIAGRKALGTNVLSLPYF